MTGANKGVTISRPFIQYRIWNHHHPQESTCTATNTAVPHFFDLRFCVRNTKDTSDKFDLFTNFKYISPSRAYPAIFVTLLIPRLFDLMDVLSQAIKERISCGAVLPPRPPIVECVYSIRGYPRTAEIMCQDGNDYTRRVKSPIVTLIDGALRTVRVTASVRRLKLCGRTVTQNIKVQKESDVFVAQTCKFRIKICHVSHCPSIT